MTQKPTALTEYDQLKSRLVSEADKTIVGFDKLFNTLKGLLKDQPGLKIKNPVDRRKYLKDFRTVGIKFPGYPTDKLDWLVAGTANHPSVLIVVVNEKARKVLTDMVDALGCEYRPEIVTGRDVQDQMAAAITHPGQEFRFTPGQTTIIVDEADHIFTYLRINTFYRWLAYDTNLNRTIIHLN